MRCAAVLLFGVLMLLSSCAHEKKPDIAAEKKAEISHAEKASAQFLSAGDFQKSLDAYKEVYRKYRRDAQVLRGISGVVEATKQRADAAYERGDLAAAGRLCRILLKSATQFKGPKGALFFDARAATARLAYCSDSLTKKGLECYRAGELKRAVTIWENVLEFDPDNAEVRKAVDTASGQMKNLR